MSKDLELSYSSVGVRAKPATGANHPPTQSALAEDGTSATRPNRARFVAVVSGAVALVVIVIVVAVAIAYSRQKPLWCSRGCVSPRDTYGTDMAVKLQLSGGSASSINSLIACEIETAVIQAATQGADDSVLSIFPLSLTVADANTPIQNSTTYDGYDFGVGNCRFRNDSFPAVVYERSPNASAAVAMNLTLSLFIYTANVSVASSLANATILNITSVFTDMVRLSALLRGVGLVGDWAAATNSSASNTSLQLVGRPVNGAFIDGPILALCAMFC